jgi:hypothetical protein
MKLFDYMYKFVSELRCIINPDKDKKGE